MSLSRAKQRADERAKKAAEVCRGFLLRSPATAMMAGNVVPNYKFFRRMIGLRGGDLRKENG